MIREELHPGERKRGLAGQIHWLAIKRSFNELHLQRTNLAEILAQGVPPPSFTKIREELHPGERKWGLAGQIH